MAKTFTIEGHMSWRDSSRRECNQRRGVGVSSGYLSGGKMQRIRRSWLRCCMLAAILLIVPDFIAALKDVSVTIPQAVKRGSNALLICNYDMENDTLYSVKWYKGRREFYRYTPKENPAMKVFNTDLGPNVERNLSNQSHVVLIAVRPNISGKYTCEISVEAPTFQTAIVSGEMEVVELPEQPAIVTGIQPRYRIGDLVDGNCSIKFSKPAANLTWTINGIVVPPHHIKTYQIEKHEGSNLESVVSAIHFMVTTQHFIKGQMRLKCTASIFDIFKEEHESVIEEDRPRIMASGRSYDMNNYPYEQHSSGDGFEDHNESYLTYYSAADITSAAAPATTPWLGWQKRWQRIWTSGIWNHIWLAGVAVKAAAAGDSSALMQQQQQEESQQQYVAVVVALIVAICATVSVVIPRLARHFISCQNGSRKKATAKGALNVKAMDKEQQLSKVQHSTKVTSVTKRKSLHNCTLKNYATTHTQWRDNNTATSTTSQATNPLQKLQRNNNNNNNSESGISNITNQNGCNIAPATTKVSCTRCHQLSMPHGSNANWPSTSSSLSLSPSSVVCNNKAIGNFVKDVSKDQQTLLMMISPLNVANCCQCCCRITTNMPPTVAAANRQQQKVHSPVTQKATQGTNVEC